MLGSLGTVVVPSVVHLTVAVMAGVRPTARRDVVAVPSIAIVTVVALGYRDGRVDVLMAAVTMMSVQSVWTCDLWRVCAPRVVGGAGG